MLMFWKFQSNFILVWENCITCYNKYTKLLLNTKYELFKYKYVYNNNISEVEHF